jgi:ABC-2 type transport system permease protein/lipopolysaccharide transport system permease protein
VTVDAGRWIENRPSRGLRAIDVRELWAYRELGWALAMRDLKVRYKQAAFGALWAVVQPVAGAAVFTFVFSRMAGVSSGDVPYVLFALVGTTAWSYHSAVVGSGTESLVENSLLVTKIYYPKLLSPLASCLPPLADLLISLVVCAALLLAYGVNAGARLLLLPVALSFLVMTAFGFALWFSALNVRYRDVRYVVRFAIQIWLFASPVAYPVQLLDGWQRWAYALNPVVGVLSLLRWTLLGGPGPRADLWVSAVVTVAVTVSGLLWFQRTERTFADVV